MRRSRCIAGCPFDQTGLPCSSSATTEEEKRVGVGRDCGMLLVLFSSATHRLHHRRRKLAGQVFLHRATRGYGLYQVNVGSEPAVRLNLGTILQHWCVGIFVCMCGLCACLCSSLSRMPGEPQTTPFFILSFSYLSLFFFFFAISVICLSRPFSLSAIWLWWTDLRQEHSHSSVILVWVVLTEFILFPQIYSENFSDSFANK